MSDETPLTLGSYPYSMAWLLCDQCFETRHLPLVVMMMACRLLAPGLCLGQCWVIVNWNRFQLVFCFNHLPLVPHICVSESGQHCCGWWLVAYSVPGLCLGQCWFIVNWNRLQFVFCFDHLLLVSHICVSESGQHCCGWWLVAYSVPGLCLGQCWFIVNWNRLQFVFCFNHLLLVSHICVSESGQHWFGWWLIAYSAPGHCSGQCWAIVNWNMLQWNFFLNVNLFISENASEDIVCEMVAFCLGGDELNHTQMIILHL